MDRRVLVVVAVAAVLAAVGLGVLLAPSTDTTPAPEPALEARAPTPTVAQARPAGQQRPRAIPQLGGSPGGSSPKGPVVTGHGPAVQVASDKVIRPAEPLTEQQIEYRCRALGQQADLIDRLSVIAAGGAVDEAQQATMVSRVAQMSMRVYDEGEQLWAGNLSCEGISDVNLGPAADFLAKMRDELDLDESTTAEVEQVLGVLDQVQWAEIEEEQ